jgi:peptidoglycan/LPS O-acetylase OafA/YrhL
LEKPAEPSSWRNPGGLGANNFDFLRLVFAVFVIFSHSFDLLRGIAPREPLTRLTGQVSFGDLGVDAFFIISGYLVTHSWFRRKNVADYVWKRVRRIYPAFVVACCFCVLVIGPFSTDDPGRPFHVKDLVKFAAATLFLRGDFQDYAFPTNPYPFTMNGSTWSIPYEARCYAAVAVLALVGLLKPRVLLPLFGLSLLAAAVFEIMHLRYGSNLLSYVVGWPHTWARLIPLYLAGVLFYVFRERIPRSNALALLSALVLCAAALVPAGMAVAIPTAGTYLLFWLAYHPGLPLHNWGRRGDFSYGTYLYAYPLQQLLIRVVPAAREPLVLFAMATPLAIAAGILSWHLVEKRFVSRQRAGHQPAPQPAVG